MKATAPAPPETSAATLWRCGGRQCGAGECEHEEGQLHRDACAPGPRFAPPVVHDVLRTSGSPLPAAVRADMEQRLGQDFADVRIHADAASDQSARAVGALAYTVGRHVVFGAGQYDPENAAGRRLIAHELSHAADAGPGAAVPQGALRVSDPGDDDERRAEGVAHHGVRDGSSSAVVSGRTSRAPGAVVRRQLHGGSEADIVAQREYGGSGAPNAQTCGRPSHCPPGFCDPYPSAQLAEYHRARNSGWILAGISAVVDSRVVPLWRDYLNGGSAPRDLTATFAADFTASPATALATTYLVGAVQRALGATRPAVATTRSVDLATLVPSAITAVNTAGGAHEMNFNVPRDVAGNLAGGIGTNQTTCRSGARPSPFDDERIASGTVELRRTSPTTVEGRPVITYRVRDTIDLCPGDCGALREQVATVPLSQFEATGISGDVPFTVDFPAPSTPSFAVSYS